MAKTGDGGGSVLLVGWLEPPDLGGLSKEPRLGGKECGL